MCLTFRLKHGLWGIGKKDAKLCSGLIRASVLQNDHGHDCCDGDGDDYSGDGSDAMFLVVEKQYNKSGKTTIRKGRTDCGQSANNGPEQQEAEKEKEE